MDDPKTLDDLINDYGFLEIIPDEIDTRLYGDCTDPEQVDGFWAEDDELEFEE